MTMHMAMAYGGTAAMPMALWLCLWPYGYHYVYGAYVCDPMPMALWPIAIPMAVAMSMPIVYGACVDKNIRYRDGA